MLRTHIYLPEVLDAEINHAARAQKKSKAEIIREVLSQGIKVVRSKQSASAKALLDMAKQAKRFSGSGPKDLSIHHDHYAWGGPKRDQ